MTVAVRTGVHHERAGAMRVCLRAFPSVSSGIGSVLDLYRRLRIFSPIGENSQPGVIAGKPASKREIACESTMIARLGKEPDRTIAEAMNVNRPAVQLKRAGLGIPKFSTAKWTPKRRALIGVISDRSLAEMVGTTADVVGDLRRKLGRPPARAAKWDQRILSDIGRMSDRVVARKYHNKVSRSEVRAKRIGMGIPSHRSTVRAAAGPDVV